MSLLCIYAILDVFVIFYAIFNEQSASFLKFYPEVAGLYTGSDKIIFAMMDYRANELEELYTRQYPVINIYKPNNEVKMYKGIADQKEHILNFIHIHSSAVPTAIKQKDIENEQLGDLEFGEEL